MDAFLEELKSRQSITDVMLRYVRAIDRMDEALLRSVFHPGSIHNHFFSGLSSDPSVPSSIDAPGDFVAFALGLLRSYSRTHHQLGPTLIEFHGVDKASAETYFTAYHRMRPSGDPLAAPNPYDNEMDFFVGGRYLDRLEQRGGEWKIVERVGMTDWTKMTPTVAQGFGDIDPTTVGQRAPDDRICHW